VYSVYWKHTVLHCYMQWPSGGRGKMLRQSLMELWMFHNWTLYNSSSTLFNLFSDFLALPTDIYKFITHAFKKMTSPEFSHIHSFLVLLIISHCWMDICWICSLWCIKNIRISKSTQYVVCFSFFGGMIDKVDAYIYCILLSILHTFFIRHWCHF
jgi:hypothetical protein